MTAVRVRLADASPAGIARVLDGAQSDEEAWDGLSQINAIGRTNRTRSSIEAMREAVERDRQWFDEQLDNRTRDAEGAIEARANWQAVVDRLLQ